MKELKGSDRTPSFQHAVPANEDRRTWKEGDHPQLDCQRRGDQKQEGALLHLPLTLHVDTAPTYLIASRHHRPSATGPCSNRSSRSPFGPRSSRTLRQTSLADLSIKFSILKASLLGSRRDLFQEPRAFRTLVRRLGQLMYSVGRTHSSMMPHALRTEQSALAKVLAKVRSSLAPA